MIEKHKHETGPTLDRRRFLRLAAGAGAIATGALIGNEMKDRGDESKNTSTVEACSPPALGSGDLISVYGDWVNTDDLLNKGYAEAVRCNPKNDK